MMTTQKPFFEVFPTLDIQGTLHDMLEQTKIERVSATKQKDRLSVYLFSTRLILKEDIRAAEREIKKQLFPNAALAVRIRERFELSSQYTPENLMEVYRESILFELQEYSHIEYNAFRTADISYPEGAGILLTLEDTVLNRSKEEELVRVLEKILVERCGLQTGIEVAYKEAHTGRYAEDDALRIQMKVNEIYHRAKKGLMKGEGAEGQAYGDAGQGHGSDGPGYGSTGQEADGAQEYGTAGRSAGGGAGQIEGGNGGR